MIGPNPKKTFLGAEVANLIQKISSCIDRGECNQNPYEFIEARRLLNNVLAQAITVYVAAERQEAFLLGVRALESDIEAVEALRLVIVKENPPSTKGGA